MAVFCPFSRRSLNENLTLAYSFFLHLQEASKFSFYNFQDLICSDVAQLYKYLKGMRPRHILLAVELCKAKVSSDKLQSWRDKGGAGRLRFGLPERQYIFAVYRCTVTWRCLYLSHRSIFIFFSSIMYNLYTRRHICHVRTTKTHCVTFANNKQSRHANEILERQKLCVKSENASIG